MLEYENQVGSKKYERNHKKNTNLCNSCTHLKIFYTIPSMKTTKRCVKYGHVSTRCNFSNCKYYNNKRKFEIIIGV